MCADILDIQSSPSQPTVMWTALRRRRGSFFLATLLCTIKLRQPGCGKNLPARNYRAGRGGRALSGGFDARGRTGSQFPQRYGGTASDPGGSGGGQDCGPGQQGDAGGRRTAHHRYSPALRRTADPGRQRTHSHLPVHTGRGTKQNKNNPAHRFGRVRSSERPGQNPSMRRLPRHWPIPSGIWGRRSRWIPPP